MKEVGLDETTDGIFDFANSQGKACILVYELALWILGEARLEGGLYCYQALWGIYREEQFI